MNGRKGEVVLHVCMVPAAKATCDVDDMSGVHISHNLIIDCVVAEERLHTVIGEAKMGGRYNQREMRGVENVVSCSCDRKSWNGDFLG